MSRRCTVCSRLDRAALDLELARPDLNVSDFCRRWKLGRASVDRHRAEHVPSMLRIYSRVVDLPKLGELHGEYLRLYMSALDNLAAAQAGTLLHIDEAGVETRTISHTGISRAINEARKTLDSVVRLAADAGEVNERPKGIADAELSARIASALERTMARAQIGEGGTTDTPSMDAINTAPVVDVEGEDIEQMAEGGLTHRLTHTPGGHVVEAGTPAPTQMSLDAVEANRTAPGLGQTARRAIEQDAATVTPLSQHEDTVIMRLPNPRYPGSPAATEEERRAAGYPDLEITLSDLRTSKQEVAEIIAQHRRTATEEGDG